MNPERPFFSDKRKRAGLIRRIGNLAQKLDGPDPELFVMYLIATDNKTPEGQTNHLKAMMASHLKFVSDFDPSQMALIATWTGVSGDLANLRTYPDILRAPETMQAAFVDIARVTQKALE
jgi:hypothetical protein